MLTAFALVGLAAVGTACGGDDDAAAAGAPSVEDFLRDANAICRAGNAEIDATMAALGETPTDEQLTAAAKFIVDTVSAELDDMRALGTPPTLAGDMEEIWSGMSEVLAEFRARGGSIFEGDDPFAELRPRLTEVGLTDC